MKMEQTAKDLLKTALNRAKEMNHNEVRSEHIMISIVDLENKAKQLLIERGINVDDVGLKMVEHLGRTVTRDVNGIIVPDPKLSTEAKIMIEDAQKIAKDFKHETLQSEHILLSLLKNNVYIGQVLNKVNQKELIDTIKKGVLMSNGQSVAEEDVPGTNKTKTKEPKSKTPILDNFSIDLCQAARNGDIDPIVGRLKEIERVSQILSRRRKNNPVLIGEPGCVLPDTKIKVRKISEKNSHTIHKI